MKPHQFIKAFATTFLLLLFALGITPKQVLHEALTNHEHVQVNNGHADWVGKDRFNCDDENFVAESPFIAQEIASITPSIAGYIIDVKFFLNSYSYLHTFFFLQRGPPAIG